MIFDKNLLFWQGDASSWTGDSIQGDWVDVNGLGVEAQDLVCFAYWPVEWSTGGLFLPSIIGSANADLSSSWIVQELPAYNPGSTAIPSGTLWYSAIDQPQGGSLTNQRVQGNSATEAPRYVGLTVNVIGASPGAGEDVYVGLCRQRDIPAYRQDLR